jgi:hypothetical protein
MNNSTNSNPICGLSNLHDRQRVLHSRPIPNITALPPLPPCLARQLTTEEFSQDLASLLDEAIELVTAMDEELGELLDGERLSSQ